MFITALVVLFIIKLRFPKGKSIHHIILQINMYTSATIKWGGFFSILSKIIMTQLVGHATSHLAQKTLIAATFWVLWRRGADCAESRPASAFRAVAGGGGLPPHSNWRQNWYMESIICNRDLTSYRVPTHRRGVHSNFFPKSPQFFS